jgi:MYXO-CTERM domain-containing protein
MAVSSQLKFLAVRVAAPVVTLAAVSATYAHADAITISYTDLGSSSQTTPVLTPGSGLLAGKQPVYSALGSNGNAAWTQDGAPGYSVLTANNPIPFGRSGATVGNDDGGEALIYNISNANISEVDLYWGWNDAGRNSAIPVSFYVNSSTTADPNAAGWSLLTTTASYSPGAGNADQNEGAIADATTPGGSIAPDVSSIEFVFGAAQYEGLNQIDVFPATATPEPASASLIVLGALPLLRRRRRLSA